MHDAVKSLFGSKMEIRFLTESTMLEVKDLDEVTPREEILEWLIAEFGEIQLSAASIVSLRRAYGGTQTATITLPAKSAKRILEAKKGRIGWVVC